jgi:hypothetical protein
LDSDSDLVKDIDDIDDDNDGVLDTVEMNGGTPLFTIATNNATTKTITGKALAGPDSFDYSMTMTGATVALPAGYADGGNGLHFLAQNTSTTKASMNLKFSFIPVAGDQTAKNPMINKIEFGPNVPYNSTYVTGNTSEPQNIRFTWAGFAYGVVFDPANQLSSHNTGDIIRSGDIITQNTTINSNLVTWKVVFYLRNTSTPFDFTASVSSVNAASMGNEFYGVNMFSTRELDDDLDTISNHLDTDSDADGCNDAYESGATTNTGLSRLTGTFGINGLLNDNSFENNDTLEASTAFASTYNFARSFDLEKCLDTDSDSIIDTVDIDDDNDGILDVNELNCGMAYFTSPVITSGLTGYSQFTGTLAKDDALADYTINFVGVSGALNATTNVDIVKGGLNYLITDNDPVYVQNITLTPSGDSSLKTVTFAPNTPLNLIGASTPVGVQKIILEWTPDVKAIVYDPADQLIESDGAVLTTGMSVTTKAAQNVSATSWKIIFQTGNLPTEFNLKLAHKTATVTTTNFANQSWGISADLCTNDDLDNDGKINSIDTDSDGDGCNDAYEASATGATSTTVAFSGSVGANGLLDTLEYNDSLTTDIKYAQTNYLSYSSVNACLDKDSD